MALTDIATKLTASPLLPHKTCGTCHALEQMDDKHAAILRALLADRSVPFTVLARELADDPDSPTIERGALSRHALGNCSARDRLRS